MCLDQFDSVDSTTPKLRADDAMLWPDSTSRTASCLNSGVYLPRCPFLIFVSLSPLMQLAMGYILRGQSHFGFFHLPHTPIGNREMGIGRPLCGIDGVSVLQLRHSISRTIFIEVNGSQRDVRQAKIRIDANRFL